MGDVEWCEVSVVSLGTLHSGCDWLHAGGESKHAANGRRARRPPSHTPHHAHQAHQAHPRRPLSLHPRCIAAASRHICSLLPVPPSLPPLVAAQSPPPPPLLPVTISPEAGHWAANTHHGPARPANHTPPMDIARRHHPHHHAYHARPCGDGLWTPLSSMAAPISQEPSALWHAPLTCTPASCTCTCTCTLAMSCCLAATGLSRHTPSTTS
jgi:hypothetical protein